MRARGGRRLSPTRRFGSTPAQSRSETLKPCPLLAVGVLLGFLEAPQLSAVLQVRDRESPTHLRSLVFVAATSLKTGAFALGSVLAAALVEWGWRSLLLGSAVIEILAVVVGLLVAGRRSRP